MSALPPSGAGLCSTSRMFKAEQGYYNCYIADSTSEEYDIGVVSSKQPMTEQEWEDLAYATRELASTVSNLVEDAFSQCMVCPYAGTDECYDYDGDQCWWEDTPMPLLDKLYRILEEGGPFGLMLWLSEHRIVTHNAAISVKI